MVHCRNCIRWYFTGADQCEVPNCGIFADEGLEQKTGTKEKRDQDGINFLKEHLEYINGIGNKVFGHPTQLNKNLDCYFYKPLPKVLRPLTKIARFIYS